MFSLNKDDVIDLNSRENVKKICFIFKDDCKQEQHLEIQN